VPSESYFLSSFLLPNSNAPPWTEPSSNYAATLPKELITVRAAEMTQRWLGAGGNALIPKALQAATTGTQNAFQLGGFYDFWSRRTHMVSKKTFQVASVVLAPLLMAGCATKKFVRNTVHPLEARLGHVEKKTTDNSQQITDVDRKAETGIADAANRADQASKQASDAQTQASHAQQTADKGLTQANVALEDVQNVDNFKPDKTMTVLFGFNHSNLTSEDKQKLDDLASTIQSMKHYVIEVQGYTDSTGPARYNLELSHRRAQSVVRYLTLDQKVPLVRIYLLGYGEDSPAAPNKTRAGRKENRRVEITLMTPQMPEGQAQASTSTGGPAPVNPQQ
jgi:OmpA-OmpF porin, OOP family